MPIPETQRVVYEQNPLAEVICQLRFPTLLRIDEEKPVAFQERLLARYPQYQRVEQVPALGGLPPQVAAALGRYAVGSQHEFLDASGIWKVALNQGFVALTTTEYERWEAFRQRLVEVVEAVCHVYQPPFVTRAGLRYRDVIQRSTLGLSDVPWSQLLQPQIAGELAAAAVADEVVEALRIFVLASPDREYRVRVQHGLAVNPPSPEQCYIIDADIFSEDQRSFDSALEVLNGFNRRAGHLFRWCIQDSLHNAMRPREVEDA